MIKFDWNKIEVKGNRSGNKRALCPECSHTRKKKNDPCLSVNFTSGKAYCHNCNAVSFREDELSDGAKKYELPNQDWHNYTALSDKLVKWCENTRRIKQSTLMDFGVTEEYQFIPQVNKQQNCIVFNYFEGSKLVNKKYRDGKKNFTQSKGGKPIFYNINSIAGSDKVYIVEGEFDVLAMYEAGIKNCISLPSGANDNDDYWTNSKPYLSDVKEFIIAVDNDEKGLKIRDKIAHRLGKYRCKYIEWEGKDANDDWLNGVIFESLKNIHSFPVDGTYNFDKLSQGVYDLYQNGLPKTMKLTKPCFFGLDNIFSTMEGQMTVVTGIPSHGKSNFLEWYLLNLIDEHNVKVSVFSPEHNPMELHMTNFIQKAVGKPFFGTVDGVERVNEEDIKRFGEWSNERLYLTGGGAGEVVNWTWIIEKFKEQIFTFGINVFVVDAWNKVQMPKGYNGKEGIDAILTKLTAFCQQHQVQLFLVAHPTKMKKNDKTKQYEVPQLYDVSGSSDFRNQTHNGFTVYRNFAGENDEEGSTDFYNLKTKFSFQGQIGGVIKFRYHVPTARYYVDGCTPYIFDLTQKGAIEPIDYKPIEEDQEIYEPKKIEPNDEFDFEPPQDDIMPF